MPWAYQINFIGSKVLWERNFFPRVDPLPSGYGGGGGGCQKSCFKSAENRAASSLEVAAN